MHKNGLSSLPTERGLQAVFEFTHFNLEYGGVWVTDTPVNTTVVYVHITNHSVTTKNSICLTHTKKLCKIFRKQMSVITL